MLTKDILFGMNLIAARGTDGLQTRPWREMASNHQYRGTKAGNFRRASRHAVFSRTVRS